MGGDSPSNGRGFKSQHVDGHFSILFYLDATYLPTYLTTYLPTYLPTYGDTDVANVQLIQRGSGGTTRG